LNPSVASQLADAFLSKLEKVAVGAWKVPALFSTFLITTLGLQLTPVFKGICDAADGCPVELDEPSCVATFGCTADALPTEPRRVVVVRAGGRAGKTARMLATKAIHAALTVPLPTLGRGEHAWALVVAPRSDLAIQCLNFVRGYFEGCDELRALVTNGRRRRRTDELTQVGTTTCITVKRPHDGKLVDIRIGVASSGGTWARGKTFVWVGFDEAEFFGSESDKVLNDRDLFQAAIQRIVPGGQLWMVSTPWIEGYGVMEETFGADWGRHDSALIAQGPTRALNDTWDPDHTIEDHMRRTDPENAAREIDAIPLAAGSKLFFPPALIEAAVNRARTGEAMHLDYLEGATHSAGTDLGFRKNSSALAVARPEPIDHKIKVRLAYHEECKPARNEALKPSEVCKGFAERLTGYRCFQVLGDIIYAPSAIEEFGKVGIHDEKAGKVRHVQYLDFNPESEAVSAAFTKLRQLMSEGALELPHDEKMLAQLRRVTSKPTPGGGVKIVLPRLGTSHGDVIFALVLAVWQVDVRPRVERGPTTRGERTMGAEPRAFGGERHTRGGRALPRTGGY
jgi:hypothetical protein